MLRFAGTVSVVFRIGQIFGKFVIDDLVDAIFGLISNSLRTLLYPPVEQNALYYFCPVLEVFPDNDVINSVVIVKNL